MSEEPSLPRNYKSVFCRHFTTKGFCLFGEKCTYFHDGIDNADDLRSRGFFPPNSAVKIAHVVPPNKSVSSYTVAIKNATDPCDSISKDKEDSQKITIHGLHDNTRTRISYIIHYRNHHLDIIKNTSYKGGPHHVY